VGSALGTRKAAATRVGVSLVEYDSRLLAGEKWCHACTSWHPRSEFGTDRHRADGLAAVCRRARERTKSGPTKAERREAAARGEAWCRDCSAWLPLGRVRGGRCRDHVNADCRARYAADGGARREKVVARRRGLVPIPGWWVTDLRADFGGLCAYGCGRPATTNDHIWPVSRGGESRPGNLVPCCRSCNSKKKNHDPTAWVDKGAAAFPEQWLDIAGLAAAHGCFEWIFPDVTEEAA